MSKGSKRVTCDLENCNFALEFSQGENGEIKIKKCSYVWIPLLAIEIREVIEKNKITEDLKV